MFLPTLHLLLILGTLDRVSEGPYQMVFPNLGRPSLDLVHSTGLAVKLVRLDDSGHNIIFINQDQSTMTYGWVPSTSRDISSEESMSINCCIFEKGTRTPHQFNSVLRT
jgi:hypothetical protein